MLGIISPNQIIKKIVEHKKFIWIVYDKNINNTMVVLKPFFDKKMDENVIYEFEKLFPNIVIYESYIQDVIDDLIEIGVDVDNLYEPKTNEYQSLIIKFEKSWISETSRTRCFCPQTLTKYIFDLYPEYIPTE
jgi:hypothetical protein